jgi:hypothetical protein
MPDGIEETALSLLAAFCELSGEEEVPVAVGTQAMSTETSAAVRAGIDPSSRECDLAVAYVLHRGWLADGELIGNYYRVTPDGALGCRRPRRG